MRRIRNSIVIELLPSALLDVAVFLISVFTLLVDADRRTFALEVVDRMLRLSGVLAGVEPSALPPGRHV